jgi:hypothetical protein
MAGDVLCLTTQGWESLVVVGARRGSTSAAASATTASEFAARRTISAAIATVSATATSLATATITAITTVAIASATVAAATVATATSTATTSRLAFSEVAAWVDISHVNSNLLFLLTEASSLAAAASHVVLILITSKCLAFWELLAGALIWLANLCGDLQLLAGELGEIVVVALGLDLRLGWLDIFGAQWLCGGCAEAFLLLFLSDGLTSLLISKFGVTSLASPAMCNLLRVVTTFC